MLKQILTYGVIAGLIVGLPLCTLIVTMDPQQMLKVGMVIGYTLMLVALSTVFVAVKRHRDFDRGGVIGFWRALGIGLAISAVAGIVYVVAWEITLALTHNDFIGAWAKHEIDQARAGGASAAELAKLTADMDAMKVNYANPLYRMPLTFAEIFPVGVLVSFVSAGLLCFPRFLPLVRNSEARAGEAKAA